MASGIWTLTGNAARSPVAIIPCLAFKAFVSPGLAVEADTKPPCAETEVRETPGKGWTVTACTEFVTKYVLRGVDVVDRPVLQSAACFEYRGLSLSAWSNLDLTNENERQSEFTEVDFTLSYSWAWNNAKFSAGAILYEFSNTDVDTTAELYFGAGLDVPLAPTLKLNWDVMDVKGGYVNLSIGHTFEDFWKLSRSVSVSAGFSAGIGFGTTDYNEYYYGLNRDAFADFTGSVFFPVRFCRHWTLRPYVAYATLLDRGIRRPMDRDDNFWTGVCLSFTY